MAQMTVSPHDQSDTASADAAVPPRDLSAEECWLRLAAAAGGRVVLVHHGRSLTIAVNHVTDGLTIVFRTGAASPLGLLASRQPASFEVDDRDPSTSTSCSVVVTGTIERVEQQAQVGIDPAPPPWAPGRVEAWIRIVPISVTGIETTRAPAVDNISDPNAATD
jgi:uncharacterized protein